MKYLLVVSYNGTNFAGFQRQKKGERTIQQELEKALKVLLKQDVNGSVIKAFSNFFVFL